MNTRVILSIGLTVVGLASAACNKGTQEAYQPGSSDCSPTFIENYNKLVQSSTEYRKKVDGYKSGEVSCAEYRKLLKQAEADVTPLEKQVTELKDKYHDVKCDADEIKTENGVEKRQKVTIDVNAKLDPAIKSIADLKTSINTKLADAQCEGLRLDDLEVPQPFELNEILLAEPALEIESAQ